MVLMLPYFVFVVLTEAWCRKARGQADLITNLAAFRVCSPCPVCRQVKAEAGGTRPFVVFDSLVFETGEESGGTHLDQLDGVEPRVL